jgi:carboxyl-terminal processing protease
MFKQKRIILWLVLTLIVLSGTFVGRLSIENVNATEGIYEGIKVFTEVISLVKKNYVDAVDDKDLVQGAIKGMLNSLDPHSSFMPPDIYKEMQINTKGEFGGLGIQISIRDSILMIIAPIEDTPAFRAGVQAGDKIMKIDGETTKDMSLHDAVSKLRGPKGTSVTITIVREGLQEPKDFTIVRDIIKIKSVKSKVIDDTIGYVKITQFQEKTGKDLGTALKGLEKEGINALVLDLRNNPGGLLGASIDVAGYFLPPDKLVVYIKGRDGKRIEYLTRDGKSLYDYPMILLVNQGTASASEIVAGALQDWDKAVVLGNKTFGKGSVQTVIPLSDGSGLRLTTAKYYTPKDRSIQAEGIEPDIIVELKTKGKGHPIVREKDLERHLKNDKERKTDERGKEEKVEEFVPREISEEDDIQLQRAIDLLKTWRVFKKRPDAA